jgi:hypothetical protein
MNSETALTRIDEAIRDQAIPKRVKLVLERVKKEITVGKKDADITLTTAIYDLDEIVNDVNIPMHSKTIIWDLISNLESIKSA